MNGQMQMLLTGTPRMLNAHSESYATHHSTKQQNNHLHLSEKHQDD